MKIYIVQSSRGIYEDYCEEIEKIFLDKSKAIKFMRKYNKNLSKVKAENKRLEEKNEKYDYWINDMHKAVIIEKEVEE